MSRMRPPMLLGPSSDHTCSVAGEPWLAWPAALDCAIASLTAAAGIVPSALARWRYIQSSAPTGSAVAAGTAGATGAVASLLVTAASPAANTIARTPTAGAIGTSFFFCIGTPTSPGRMARQRALTPSRRSRLCGVSLRRTPRRRGQSTPEVLERQITAMAASLEAFGDNHAMRERLSRRRLFVVAVGVATLV